MIFDGFEIQFYWSIQVIAFTVFIKTAKNMSKHEEIYKKVWLEGTLIAVLTGLSFITLFLLFDQ